MTTALRPHPFAFPPHQIKAFDFLLDSVHVATNDANWTGPVATVTLPRTGTNDEKTEIILTDDNETDLVERLYDAAAQSAVGKNEDTVIDEDVRSSREIMAEHIKLDPTFQAWVTETVADAGITLNHPVPMRAKLYKLVLYTEGDVFVDHMDAPHSEGMIATFTVELFAGGRDGGDLQFKDAGDNMQPTATKDLISWSLFYHDVKHRVTLLEYGWRVSLVFDVVESGDEKQELIDPIQGNIRKNIRSALRRLKREGVRRVGFLLNHVYMEPKNIELQSIERHLAGKMPKDLVQVTRHFLDTTRLKGLDRVMCHFFKSLGLEPSLIQTCVNDDGMVFDARLIPVFYLSGTFGALFRRHEDEGLDEEDEEDTWDGISGTLPDGSRLRKNNADTSNTHVDSKGEYEAIAESCLLGDVVFLRSAAVAKVALEGKDELHLGNSGFQGTIYDNLAMIVSLDPLQASTSKTK